MKLTKKDHRRIRAEEELIFDVTEAICVEMQREDTEKKDLAKELGCGASHVTQLLSGERNMTLRTLARIANALDCTAEVTFTPKGN